MAEFAQVMQSAVDRPIIDQTGLTGRWDFLLKWTVDPNAPAALFAAMQEQLGLRLEPTRAQVDAIVIDTVDRPTPN